MIIQQRLDIVLHNALICNLRAICRLLRIHWRWQTVDCTVASTVHKTATTMSSAKDCGTKQDSVRQTKITHLHLTRTHVHFCVKTIARKKNSINTPICKNSTRINCCKINTKPEYILLTGW